MTQNAANGGEVTIPEETTCGSTTALVGRASQEKSVAQTVLGGLKSLWFVLTLLPRCFWSFLLVLWVSARPRGKACKFYNIEGLLGRLVCFLDSFFPKF